MPAMPWSKILLQMSAVLGLFALLLTIAIVLNQMQNHWPSPATADERWLVAASLERVKREPSPLRQPCIGSTTARGSNDVSEASNWSSASSAYSSAQLHEISQRAEGRPVMLPVDSTPTALAWWKAWEFDACEERIALGTPRFEGDLAFVDVTYTGMLHRVFAWRRHGKRWQPIGDATYDTRPII